MQKVVVFVLVFTVAALSAPSLAYAAGPAKLVAAKRDSTLNGEAKNAQGQPLPKYKVQIRAKNGSIAGTTTSDNVGDFSFTGLPADDYTVEILDASGKVVGVSPVVTVPANATVSLTVTASAAGAIGGATAGGFSMFGLGTTTSVLVIAGGATLATVGIVKATNNASPSR